MSDGLSDYMRRQNFPFIWHESHAESDRDGDNCKRCGAVQNTPDASAFCTVVRARRLPDPPADLFPGNRKEFPVFTGLLMYFPNACAAVARCSYLMNQQHNPGEPMHWAKEKSIGTGDETVRHLMDSAAGTPPQVVEINGTPHTVEHAANHAWRALEYLERLILKQRAQS